jgi:hypothetical protein
VALFVPVAAAALAGAFLFPDTKAGLNESIYLATTLAAAWTLWCNDVLSTPAGAPGAAAVRLAAAAAAALCGAGLLDRPLVLASSGWLAAIHLAFAACNVAFLGLWAYLRARGAAAAAGGVAEQRAKRA